jgi:hypothetical protein
LFYNLFLCAYLTFFFSLVVLLFASMNEAMIDSVMHITGDLQAETVLTQIV